MPIITSGGGGGVTSVTAADGSIVVGGTAVAPTVATGTLDAVATAHPPTAAVALNAQKITGLANGAAAQDGAAFGQIPVITNYALIQDQEAQNTSGGTFTSGAWRTRVLNTIVTDTGGIVALASNQVTLAAGTYLIHGRAPAFGVDRHQTRLQNITGAATLLTGSGAFASNAAVSATTDSTVQGKIILAAQTVIELQHRCQTTRATQGLGTEANFTTEVYVELAIWKVA